MAPCLCLWLVLASLVGAMVLVASNPSVYPTSGIFRSEVVPGENTTAFFLYQDLQTFMGASATCKTQQQTMASITSAEQMAVVTNLTLEFWASDAASDYLSAPRSPPASPGKPGSVGFMNQSLFNGCVWIGMSNLNHPGHETYLSNRNSTTSLGFQDNADMADYILNMRSGSPQSPVRLSGWSFYGATPPVTSAGSGVDHYATCAMLCPQPSPQQLSFDYSTIVMASCTNIALPYVCKLSEPAELTPLPHTSATPEGKRSRMLSSESSSAHTTTESSSTGAATPSFTQVLGVAVTEHESWPITPDPVNTSLPDGTVANCFPGGLYDYCVFPETMKRTQADWMYVCWDAGLEPLDVNNYATLVTMLALQPSTPGWPGNVLFVHTQSFTSSNSPIPVNLYSETSFLQEYMAATEPLPSPNLPQSTLTIPLYNSSGKTKQPQPGWPYVNTPNTTCGPDGFGFGCALALSFGKNKSLGLASVSANLLANGMCQRLSTRPSPRPALGAIPVVRLAFQFRFTDLDHEGASAIAAMITDESNTVFQEEFITKLAKLAVPSALPGVSAEDVQVPTGPVTTLWLIPEDTPAPNISDLKMWVAVMLFVTLPYTVNTTDLVDAYLMNLNQSLTSVLPPSFVEEYHLAEDCTCVLADLSGNIDVASSSSSNSLAVSVGVGIGVGLPLTCLLAFGIYKFYKDANPSKKGGKGEV